MQLSGDFIAFQDLLKESRKWNIFDQTMEAVARDVANAGDEVMHEKPPDLIDCRRASSYGSQRVAPAYLRS
ncbi:MAG: hypothetical protein ACLQMO_16535 [Acidobacteriaceae bacterium]